MSTTHHLLIRPVPSINGIQKQACRPVIHTVVFESVLLKGLSVSSGRYILVTNNRLTLVCRLFLGVNLLWQEGNSQTGDRMCPVIKNPLIVTNTQAVQRTHFLWHCVCLCVSHYEWVWWRVLTQPWRTESIKTRKKKAAILSVKNMSAVILSPPPQP